MEQDPMAYDEDQAVKFIRTFVPDDIRDKYTDDEILFIVDTIWDYYEAKGLLEVSADFDDEEQLDIKALGDYVRKEIKKDGELVMDPVDIEYIVKGELAYEESLDMFGD